MNLHTPQRIPEHESFEAYKERRQWSAQIGRALEARKECRSIGIFGAIKLMQSYYETTHAVNFPLSPR